MQDTQNGYFLMAILKKNAIFAFLARKLKLLY